VTGPGVIADREAVALENIVASHDLELIGVGKVYDNGTPAVVDFDLTVEKGEFIAFLGPSGCGKTTTLRMIAGFETITSGDMLIRGRRINDIPPERRPTSMIFQNYALFPHMSVRQNVGYGLEVKRLPKAERDTRVDRILDVLDLEKVADRRPDRLSGGQRQRVALARGLIVEPDILLLDEPLGALDANLRRKIQSELKLLQRTLGITFVFVTHAQSEALTLSDRIVVMNHGRIEQISAPYELYTRPRTSFTAQFIGHNSLFDGRAASVSGDSVTVDTPAGRLVGAATQPVTPGAAVRIAVPSEALDVFAAPAGSEPALGEDYAGNVLSGTVTARDSIGHVVQLTIRLAQGEIVQIEGHEDKFRDAMLTTDAPVWIAWPPHEASVFPT
jgi:putative spermidine/putrescine transport system ATP-binding protein/spermidine/putrescine transport system ATP-binding protein